MLTNELAVLALQICKALLQTGKCRRKLNYYKFLFITIITLFSLSESKHLMNALAC